jgi:hypothetical protein
MTNPIGPLLPEDEGFCHQIIDTFATVGTSDLAWTEKACISAMARDGSLQIGFGLGKYTNRDVMDGYAGISRGVEQITVRASRRLAPEPARTVVGPIRYEVVEPLKKIRFVLERNDVQPIAFDWLFEGVVPPNMEDRTHLLNVYRTSAELVRYHQTGLCSGWVELDGVRTQIRRDTWVATRDHSWGVRYDVGAPMTDLEPSAYDLDSGSYEFLWSPVYMERPDGGCYALFLNWSLMRWPGFEQKSVMAFEEHPDGRVVRIIDIKPDVTYDPRNRRLRGGTLHCTMTDGTKRPLKIEVVSDTGFHLGTGLYFGFDGHHHGEWRGKLHVDGERIADCSTPENARRVHQIRDTVIHVLDPVGGGEGWGNYQPVITGAHPERGLSREDSFW